MFKNDQIYGDKQILKQIDNVDFALKVIKSLFEDKIGTPFGTVRMSFKGKEINDKIKELNNE